MFSPNICNCVTTKLEGIKTQIDSCSPQRQFSQVTQVEERCQETKVSVPGNTTDVPRDVNTSPAAALCTFLTDAYLSLVKVRYRVGSLMWVNTLYLHHFTSSTATKGRKIHLSFKSHGYYKNWSLLSKCSPSGSVWSIWRPSHRKKPTPWGRGRWQVSSHKPWNNTDVL